MNWAKTTKQEAIFLKHTTLTSDWKNSIKEVTWHHLSVLDPVKNL